ncbi:MAG: MFS transporter [Gemmatimonadaceae bacterium]|nr:MFS transporter [Gloeobacterales cyanobacterium ES-bin-141]
MLSAWKVPRNVWVLGSVSLLTDISSKMVQSLLPLFLVTVLGASVWTVGIIEGIAETTASLVKVFSGTLSDYLGRRKSLAVFGYGLSALVKPLFIFATSPTWVFVARFGDRIGKGIRGAPRDALVADSTPPELRGAAYGLRQSLDTVGSFSGPIAAFVLMAASGDDYRFVFTCALVPALLGVVLLVRGVSEPATGEKRAKPLRWEDRKRLSREYWVLLWVALLFNLGNSSEAFLLLRATEVGIGNTLVPLTLVVLNLAYSLSAYPLGVLSDRVGRTGLLAGGLFLYALVYLGFAFANAPWQIWSLFALYGLYLGLSQGALSALIADRVPADLRGTAFGLLNLVVGGALLPASLLAGWLWERYGSYTAFLLGSGFALAAGIALLIVERPSRR